MLSKDEVYPFIVKNILVRIRGSGYNNALNRVLSRHPNKKVKTKYAKNMDIIAAKTQAAKESAAQKKPFYVFVDKDGEADISSAPLAGTLHKFVNGVEDKDYAPKQSAAAQEKSKPKIPAQSDKAQKLISKSKVQQMENKKKAAKKPAKKAIAKKSSPNTVKEEKLIRGNNMALTKAQWAKVDALLKKEETTFSSFSRELVLAKIK